MPLVPYKRPANENINPNRKPAKPKSPEIEAEVTKILSGLLEEAPSKPSIKSVEDNVVPFKAKEWNLDRLKAARESLDRDCGGLDSSPKNTDKSRLSPEQLDLMIERQRQKREDRNSPSR